MALGKNLKTEQTQNFNEENDSFQRSNELSENMEESEKEKESNSLLFCVFSAGSEEYAIPMDCVKEVIKMTSLTPIPQMPKYFSSMANIRGEVYGILDLSLFFQNSLEADRYSYLLVLNDEEYRVCIALNKVPNTLKVDANMIEELSSSTFGLLKGKEFLTGIVRQDKQLIILFDVKALISSKKFTEVLINN